VSSVSDILPPVANGGGRQGSGGEHGDTLSDVGASDSLGIADGITGCVSHVYLRACAKTSKSSIVASVLSGSVVGAGVRCVDNSGGRVCMDHRRQCNSTAGHGHTNSDRRPSICVVMSVNGSSVASTVVGNVDSACSTKTCNGLSADDEERRWSFLVMATLTALCTTPDHDDMSMYFQND